MTTNRPDSLERRLERLEQRIHELETSPRAGNTSIAGNLRVRGGSIEILDSNDEVQLELSTDGLTVAGLLEVVGGLRVNGGGDIVIDGGELRAAGFEAGESGYRLGGDGVLEVNELVAREGIIGIEALATPIATATASDGGVHSSSNTGMRTVTVPVPAWANEASVVGHGFVSAEAPIDVAARYQAFVRIQGMDGFPFEGFVDGFDGAVPVATVAAQHSATVIRPEVDPWTQIAVSVEFGAQGFTSLPWVSAVTAFAVFTR